MRVHQDFPIVGHLARGSFKGEQEAKDGARLVGVLAWYTRNPHVQSGVLYKLSVAKMSLILVLEKWRQGDQKLSP